MRSRSRFGRRLFALVATASALAAVFALQFGVASASACTSPYCGGYLVSGRFCVGAARWEYQTYGWGESGGVCVAVTNPETTGCTSAAMTGVYSANVGANVLSEPVIFNNYSATQLVHGIALTH